MEEKPDDTYVSGLFHTALGSQDLPVSYLSLLWLCGAQLCIYTTFSFICWFLDECIGRFHEILFLCLMNCFAGVFCFLFVLLSFCLFETGLVLQFSLALCSLCSPC